jgi:acyl-CoA synthetase (AMP-forming)/AMP-acid ligase II
MVKGSATEEPELIIELVKRQLGQAPHATAVEYGEHKLTWRKLDSRIRRAATGLRAALIRPGDRFAVLAHNHPACLEALFAAALTGTTAVIVNWRLTEEEIVEILRTQQVKLLFVGVEFLDALERIRPRLDELDSVVMIGTPRHDPHGTDDYELWLETHETGEGMYEAAQHRPHVDDPVLQAHPLDTRENVVLSHRALHQSVAAVLIEPAETNVIIEPLFLVDGVRGALRGIRAGARTVLVKK